MNIRRISFTTVNLLGAIVLFCAILLSPYKSQADDGEYVSKPLDVIFYEIMWMGSSSDTSDEWIVLENTTDSVIDIDNWYITKKSGDKIAELEGLISATGYYLIARKDKDESILNIDPDLISNKLTLSNSELELSLYNQFNNIIDIAGNGGSPLAGINGKNGNSKVAMDRKLEPISCGKLIDSWKDSDGPGKDENRIVRNNLDSNDYDIADPINSGKPNITSQFPDQASTELSIPFILNLTVENGNGRLSSQVNNDPSTKKVIAEGNNKISINCPKIGQQEISIRVTDESGLYDEIKGEMFCYQFADLVINEIYPAPQKGEEEWVEIFNPTDSKINLEKWRLVDESGADFTFTSNHVISPKGYLKVVPEGISLNNTGDTIELFSPADELVSSAQWGKAEKGTSWAKFDNNYKWTLSPTPSAINILTEEQGNEEDEDSDEDESVTTGSEDELSGGGESEGDYAITTKKTSGGDKLLALALNTEQLPKITISQNFSENSSLPSPLPQENSIVVGVTVGSIGVLALAKIVLSMISLWL